MTVSKSPSTTTGRDRTREVARVMDVPLIDLANLMPKDSAFYYDMVHHNNKGAAKLAGILFAKMCPILGERFDAFATAPCPQAGAEK